VRPWMIVLALALLYVLATLLRYGGDPLAFAMVGTRYSEGEASGTSGYDGQFGYYIARDPATGWRYCDVPAYRYQRILYPALARALSFGWAALVPWALVLVNIAALAGGTYVTEELLGAFGASRWYALGYGLYGGLVAGLRLDLTEPLAYGLVQAALWAWTKEKKAWSGCLFALAALAKEPALVAAAGLILSLVLERRWREAVWLGLGIVIPFVAWQVVLWAWLGSPGIGSGGEMATPFEWLPLMGLWRVASVSLQAFVLLLVIESPLFVFPAMWALVTSIRSLLRGRRDLWVTNLFAQAAVLMFLPFSTWREPLAIARLATGLVTAVMLYGAWRHSRRVLNYGMFWLATLALLINETTLPV